MTCQVEIEKEILSKRLFRRQSVARNDLAQRRQAVFGEVVHVAFRLFAISAAMSIPGFPAGLTQ